MQRIEHKQEEIAFLQFGTSYMLDDPKEYIYEYNFYLQEIYNYNTFDVVVSLQKKFNDTPENGLQRITYTDEDLLVIWTIINICSQLFEEGSEQEKKFSMLMDKFAPFVVLLDA